jgi:hypothetical protein
MSQTASTSRADIIGRILGYMDRPWKVAAIAGLAILCGLGWLIWDQRERVAERFLPAQHQPPHLKSRETVAAALADLAALDSTALVTLWAVDIRANSVRFVAASAHDHSPWSPETHNLPDRLPAMIDTTSAANFVAVLRGESQCLDTVRTVGLLATELLAEGLLRVCIVPVPPAYGKVLGVLILAWRQPSPPGIEDAAVAAAAEAAIGMVSR